MLVAVSFCGPLAIDDPRVRIDVSVPRRDEAVLLGPVSERDFGAVSGYPDVLAMGSLQSINFEVQAIDCDDDVWRVIRARILLPAPSFDAKYAPTLGREWPSEYNRRIQTPGGGWRSTGK